MTDIRDLLVGGLSPNAALMRERARVAAQRQNIEQPRQQGAATDIAPMPGQAQAAGMPQVRPMAGLAPGDAQRYNPGMQMPGPANGATISEQPIPETIVRPRAQPARPAQRMAPRMSEADMLNERELQRVRAARESGVGGYARGGMVKGDMSAGRRKLPGWCK